MAFFSNNFSTIMSCRQFELIMRYLQLNDSEKQPEKGDTNYDRLYKIRPIYNEIINNFKTSYIPQQNISIDESIIGFKGRLSWIQYMPKKPTKWGIKSWVLADSETAYVWNMALYTGITV